MFRTKIFNVKKYTIRIIDITQQILTWSKKVKIS